jgi:hypothetical protein
LDSLITSDINTSSEKILNNPWRGAEAWHFYILCQRQLYSGQFKSALKTALRLTEYELDMDPKKIYTLVALAAYYNKVSKLLNLRVINNVPEHLSSYRVWELLIKGKDTRTWLLAFSLNINQRKHLGSVFLVQVKTVKKWLVNMTPVVEAVAVISLPV